MVEEEYEEYEEDDEQFLRIVKPDVLINSTGTPWTVITSLNKRDIEFKIDTGADVTVIPESHYCKEQDGPLILTKRILTGAGRNPLGVRERFTGVWPKPTWSSRTIYWSLTRQGEDTLPRHLRSE